MLVRENFVNYQDSRLHYATAGNGPVPLLIFHGFGQDHQIFEDWVRTLQPHYRLYAFDLYFHGLSTWPMREPLEKTDWQKIIHQFLNQEKISSFHVAGFSLGGKFALATFESFSERIQKVILIAPDGINTSIWYSLATFPIFIRRLFKSMVLKPGRYYSTVNVLRALHLVNKGMVRFAESQMNTEEKRRRVYYSWVYFRHLRFNIPRIAEQMNKSAVPLLLVAGKYDRVVPVRNMSRLTKLLHQKQVEIVESGHNDLVRSALKFLV